MMKPQWLSTLQNRPASWKNRSQQERDTDKKCPAGRSQFSQNGDSFQTAQRALQPTKSLDSREFLKPPILKVSLLGYH
jgi:hypothetical protein